MSSPFNMDTQESDEDRYLQILHTPPSINFSSDEDQFDEDNSDVCSTCDEDSSDKDSIDESFREQFTRQLNQNKLACAIMQKNTSVVSDLIFKGVDVHFEDRKGWTPLHLAVKSTSEDILKLLIEAGADIESENSNRETPLHVAVKLKNKEIVQYLLSAGAKVNAEDESRNTPLHLAVKNGHIDIAVMLLNAGANINAKAEDQVTPLHIAAASERVNILKLLLDSGADVRAQDWMGNTPLHKSAHKLHSLNIFKLLIDAGASVNVYNVNGYTPLTYLFLFLDDKVIVKKKSLIEKSLKLIIEYFDFNQIDDGQRNLLNTSLVKMKFYHKIIIEHIAKIKLMNLAIDQNLLTIIFNHSEFNDYFIECTKELEKAKSNKLHQCWVTFFNLLLDGESKLVKYAGNKDLVKDVGLTNLQEKFPIFGSDMLNNIKKGITKRKSFDVAANVLSKYIPIFSPTHLVIRDILDTVNEEDWKNLNVKKRQREH